MTDFVGYPKIARYSREVIVTENLHIDIQAVIKISENKCLQIL
jgi:hypothetical protein